MIILNGVLIARPLSGKLKKHLQGNHHDKSVLKKIQCEVEYILPVTAYFLRPHFTSKCLQIFIITEQASHLSKNISLKKMKKRIN